MLISINKIVSTAGVVVLSVLVVLSSTILAFGVEAFITLKSITTISSAGTTTLTPVVTVNQAGTIATSSNCPTLGSITQPTGAGDVNIPFTGLTDNSIYSQCTLTFDPTASGVADAILTLPPFGVAVTPADLAKESATDAVDGVWSGITTFITANIGLLLVVVVFGSLFARFVLPWLRGR